MGYPPSNGPINRKEQGWFDNWIHPNTKQPFVDMSDGIVAKTCNKKTRDMTEPERLANRKYCQLKERRRWLWAKYRSVKLPAKKQYSKARVYTEAQKARASELVSLGFRPRRRKCLAYRRLTHLPALLTLCTP